MCDECTWRCTARAVSIIGIICTCIAIIYFGYLMLLAFDAIKYDPPKPGSEDYDSQNSLYKLYQNCREIGGTLFVINILLGLCSLAVDVLLYLATDIQRAARDRRQCFTWVIIWLVFSCLALIGGCSSGGQMSEHGGENAHTFAFPVLGLIWIVLVIPYAVELNRPEVQVYYVPSQPQTQDPSMYSSNPNDPNAVVGAQGGYPQQGGHPQQGGYPQPQQPMVTPSQQVAQAP